LKCVELTAVVRRSLAHLSRNNSGSSATAGIRAVGLPLHLEQLLKSVFRIKVCQQTRLQNTSDSLRLGFRTLSPRDLYGESIRWLLVFIYDSDLQHYFLSKFKFLYNSTLYSVTTSTNGGKKVRILSQLRELGLPVGDTNRMLFLKQWPT
jgi:hypothetical protein